MPAPVASQGEVTEVDVVVVGGALSGAATALLLKRQRPELRVLILERSKRLGRRVGEATVEVSAYFLTRVLGLTRHLNESHIVKQGFRFWFANEQVTGLGDSSEAGGRYLARVPTFQVDRAVLDREVLLQAEAAGVELWRPAVAEKILLKDGDRQTVSVRMDEERRTVSARWVVDASGVAATVARQKGWWQPNLSHPTSAVWARWRGVRDMDGLDLADRHPAWAAACLGMRGTATNHIMGQGWWAWVIPLKGGDVSVGVVYDERQVAWPEEGPLGQRLKDFISQHPAGRELLADAQWIEGDVLKRRHLAYSSCRYAGDGFVLVGDAAAFLDPLYSPGLDWVAYTVTAGVDLIRKWHGGASVPQCVQRHNQDFARTYQRWFQAVYQDKYEYLGDYELMRLAFLLDLGFYYLGVASQPYKRGGEALKEPVFSHAVSLPFYRFMRCYNRRFARMARERRRRGVWGRHNAGRRWLFGGFTFHPASSVHLVRGCLQWLLLEVKEGWRTWFRPRPHRDPIREPSVAEPAPSRT